MNEIVIREKMRVNQIREEKDMLLKKRIIKEGIED